MKIRKLPATLLLPALLALFLAACGDDDPAAPNPPEWQEVDAALIAGTERVAAVDFAGGHGLAMAVVLTVGPYKDAFLHEFYALQPGGDWAQVELGTLRAGLVGVDLVLDDGGGAVVAGFQFPPGAPSVVADLRGAEPKYVEQQTFGMLTIDGEGDFMVAGGRARGGGLWTSTAAGVWSFDTLPLAGTNDSGFRDVDVRGDRAIACGYDDGADVLQVVLSRTTTTGWEHIAPDGPGTRAFLSVALDVDGTIYVGGVDGAGGVAPQAFLTRRSAAGDWTDLALPDPGLLQRVQDILLAADGSIYLACGGELDTSMANLVHLGPEGARKVITPFLGGLLQVAEAPDGSLYAVGYRRDGESGEDTGVMLVNRP